MNGRIVTATQLFGSIAIAAMIATTVIVLLLSYLVSVAVESRRQRAVTRETRQRLADVVELAADWVWETDSEHRFIYVSDRFAEVTGLDPNRFIGWQRTDLPTLEGFQCNGWTRHLEALHTYQPFHRFRYGFVDPSGVLRTFSVSGKPIFDGNGCFVGYRGTGSDVSEAVNARADADAAAAHARLVLDSALDAFVSMDIDGRVVDWNPAAEATFGWTREEVHGARLIDLIVPPGERAAHLNMLKQLRSGQANFMNRRARTTALRRDGGIFPCELTITETTTPTGVTFNTFMRDITEQEQHQNALERARQEAEIANRAKSEFLAGMSHELRTPLNAVIGFSDLLLTHPTLNEEGRREYLQDIRSSGGHLLDLINDVLDLSKVEAGRLELEDELLEVREICGSCMRLVTERAHNADIALHDEVPDDLPLAIGDPKRVKQILINLLGNAVKFTNRGGSVTVSAAVTASGELHLSVADTGIGMKPEEVAKALEPFSQLDSSYSRQKQGTGLGLALAKTLVKLHSGSLEVDTAPGAGTTVTFVLPAERVHVPSGANAEGRDDDDNVMMQRAVDATANRGRG